MIEDYLYARRRDEISSLALNFLCDGINERMNGNIEKAILFYAISWGFNSYQEFDEGKMVCDRLLIQCGVLEENLGEWHKYGVDIVCFIIRLLANLEDGLNSSRIFSHDLNPPRGIF
ncbi:MAG: hypothetical protein QW727_02635 [Candidatus Pacearchaeota archaeon]